MVLHVDVYMAGSHPGFEGSKMYLVACCSMCTFGALEPVSGANATTFASAIKKLQLCYGFCILLFWTRIENYTVFAVRL